jgi:signal transduction histidine kinase/CheY-like chemotaxis protein
LAADEQCALAGDGRLRRSFGFRHPDGRRMWLSCEAVRTPAEGHRLAWTGYLVDASQEHQLQQRLVQAAQSRNLMLASASHELRAPAHMLALALQALSPQGLPPVQQRALRSARDAVETLSQLLGDVLDAARFDGAPLRVQPRDFDLHELLARIEESAAAHAASKGLGFEARIDPALPARIHLDPLRLRQVIVNLLSNAIKYTSQGRVSLRLSRLPAAANGDEGLLVEVTDTGPGIDAARQERLFTPFASAQPSAPREGSSGLGLSICRQLTQAMGGQLTLHSAPGQGTRVSVQLPLRSAAALPEGAVRQGVVLVCDDDPISRLLLAELLGSHGFEVEEVERAEAALERCHRGGVAALITDLQMPGLDGAGLLRRLRAESDAGRLSLPARVVCSGDGVDGETGTLLDLADARLVKPVDLALLLQTLQALGVRPALGDLSGAAGAKLGDDRGLSQPETA